MSMRVSGDSANANKILAKLTELSRQEICARDLLRGGLYRPRPEG